MAEFPLILAGPILRRVEPTLVSVWIALSQPKALLLTVFDGRENTGTVTGVFTGGQPRMRGAANTLRVGENLHVGVVFAEVPKQQALTSAQNYSYNLAFGSFVTLSASDPATSQAAVLDPTTINPTADLKSEKLLSDQTIAGVFLHKALGYDEGELPGFALPPDQLTDLRLLHGSCRRPGHVYFEGKGTTTFDGLAWVDDLISRWRGSDTGDLNANIRPHQLFLTGDQIYADDVAEPLLPMVNRLGNDVLGKTELLPTRFPPDPDVTSQFKFLNEIGISPPTGFDSLEKYLQKRKSESKTATEIFDELKEVRLNRVLNDPCLELYFKLLIEKNPPRPPGYKTDPAAPGLRFWPATLDYFPAELRENVLECEAKLTSSDLESHLMSFGEYCAMYLAVFSGAVWDVKDGVPRMATIADVFPSAVDLVEDDGTGRYPELYELHTGIKGLRLATPPGPVSLADFMAERRSNKSTIEGFTRTIDTLNVFFGSLSRVRRALANIPTYMILDDHDVTDDWNLSRAWRDRVLTAPLGRRIITNALLAYTLFQDWGNDPKRSLQGDYRKLLEQAAKFFPADAKSGPPVAVTTELEKLFALNHPDPEKDPGVKWHFSVDGQRHRVVVLDTRSRRVFRSRYQPPGLLSPKALKEQLPDPLDSPLPAGIDVLLVVSQTPALHPSLASSLIVPFKTRLNDLKNRNKTHNLIGIDPDNEIWPGDDQAYEEFLDRLAQYKKVVVLSGEVHFGFSARMSYWRRGLKRLDLADSLQSDLDSGNLTAPLRSAFGAAGFPLSGQARLSVRENNDEWLVIDTDNRTMFLIRKEDDGLNVYEEEPPARIAQFTSSGLKNVPSDVIKIGRGMGFGFTLIDMTPAERLIWKDNTPKPLKTPEGVRLVLPVRGRLSSAPVRVPSRNWPLGTKMISPPDFCWRMDLVRDERPDNGPSDNVRPSFVRPDPMPEFNGANFDTIKDSYSKIAEKHAGLVSKLRFSRGVLYQSNLGLVRFEMDDQDLVAIHELHSHEPGKHEAVLINSYRVPLQVFDEERPQLHFDLVVECENT